jgi:GT2 family glycosyltransferase
MGACQTVRRKDLDVVGMYDEMFFFYVEDMEWCRRMWMHGKKVVWLPSAQMYHLHEQASMTTPWGFLKFNKFVRWHIVSFLKYKLKYRKIT